MDLAVNGASTQFYIENDCLAIKSRFTSFSVNIENDKIIELQEECLADFLNKTRLQFTFKCLFCGDSERLYRYSANMSLCPFINERTFTFREKVATNNWLLSQTKNTINEWGIIKTFKKNPLNGLLTFNKSAITTPFFDLKKMTPEKLEYKLKTHIVFS